MLNHNFIKRMNINKAASEQLFFSTKNIWVIVLVSMTKRKTCVE